MGVLKKSFSGFLMGALGLLSLFWLLGLLGALTGSGGFLVEGAFCFPFARAAFQQDLSQKHQKSTILTIYPNNLGLVQDVREFSILEGDTRLLIYDIARKFKEG